MDQKTIKSMRAASRKAMLENQALHGRARAEAWGGKPSNRKTRRNNKLQLKKGDY